MTRKKPRSCRECGCTDNDCRRCIEKTGAPCYWVEFDLCSACARPVEDHASLTARERNAGGRISPPRGAI